MPERLSEASASNCTHTIFLAFYFFCASSHTHPALKRHATYKYTSNMVKPKVTALFLCIPFFLRPANFFLFFFLREWYFFCSQCFLLCAHLQIKGLLPWANNVIKKLRDFFTDAAIYFSNFASEWIKGCNAFILAGKNEIYSLRSPLIILIL